MDYSTFLVCSVGFIALLVIILSRNPGFKIIEILPSSCWLFFCIIPLAVQYDWFSPKYVGTQSLGVTIFTAAIFLADIVSLQLDGSIANLSETHGSKLFGKQFLKSVSALGALVIVTTQVIHMSLMPTIPLLQSMKQAERLHPGTLLMEDFLRVWQSSFSMLGTISSDKNSIKIPETLTAEDLAKNLSRMNLAVSEWRKAMPKSVAGTDDPIDKEVQFHKILTSCTDKVDQTSQELLTTVGQANPGVKAAGESVKVISSRLSALYESGFIAASQCNAEIQSVYLALARENSSKLLKASAFFIYFTQTMLILTPAVVFMVARYWGISAAICLAAFSLFYSRATLAKGPIYLMMLTYAFLAWNVLPAKAKKWGIRAGAASLSVYLCIAIQFFLYHPLSLFKFRAPMSYQKEVLSQASDGDTSGSLTFTLTDHYRAQSMDNWFFRPSLLNHEISLKSYQNYFNFLAYRTWLVPMEVSHRWYSYFPEHSGGFLGFYGFTFESKAQPQYRHPSNTVALWSYARMYPKRYLQSAHAYASVDADAYARFGLTGVVIAAILVALLRVYLTLFRRHSYLEQSLYYTALISLAVSMPASSLQAILSAQGLLFIVLVGTGLAAIRFYQNKSRVKVFS